MTLPMGSFPPETSLIVSDIIISVYDYSSGNYFFFWRILAPSLSIDIPIAGWDAKKIERREAEQNDKIRNYK